MKKSFFIYVVLLFFVLEPVFAVKEIVFRQQTQVYSQQDENSGVIGVYSRGDAIPVSSKKYGAWKKVVVESDGKKKIGWVLVKDIIGAKIREASDSPERLMLPPVYHEKVGVGLWLALAYGYQTKGNLSFNTVGGPVSAQFSSLKGANFYLGFFGDYNLSSTKSLRGYLGLRQFDRSGSGDIQVPGGLSGPFKVKQSLLSVGSTLKFYSSPKSPTWWGVGLEIGKTTKMKFEADGVGGNKIDADMTEEPFYILPTLSAGYDLNLMGTFFFLPEVRFGIVPNGKPMIMNFEVLLPLSYSF